MPVKTDVPAEKITDLETLLVRAGAKERVKAEKHLAACDAEAGTDHGRLWRWVVLQLGSLTPLGMQSSENNSWRFFIPDGKYRMQVFAFEDPCNGTLLVYMPDVLAEAVKARILGKTKDPQEYAVAGSRHPMRVELLDAANTTEPAAHVKHLLGWNRKALRVTLSTVDASEAQATAASALFALAAKHFPAAPAVAVKTR